MARDLAALWILLVACSGTPGRAVPPSGPEFPFCAELPAGLDVSRNWTLVRRDDERTLPVQIAGGKAYWVDASPAGRYRLVEGEASGPGVAVSVEGESVAARVGAKEVFRYNTGRVPAPAGVDPAHVSTGYLHPVRTPSGRVISNDHPKGHEHHHGVWYCWRTGEFEGRKLNAFAPLEKLGRMEFVKLEGTFSGPVFGGFRSRQRLVDLNAPGGPQPVLEDAWEVRVYAVEGAFVFDLESTQTCASASPFTIVKNYYGGLGFRGSAEWEGKQGVAFLTSEGKTRLDGNGTAARWVLMTGLIGGRPASFGLLSHASNFRAPQATRLNPVEPYFSWVPAANEPFRIEPGKPFVSRYRFIAADHALSAAEMEAHWAAYADPSAGVVLVRD